MRRGLTILVAVALLAAVLAPGTSYAATSKSKLQKSAKELAGQLAKMRAEFNSAQRDYERSLSRLENTGYRIRAIDRRYAAEGKKLEEAQALLGRRASSLYRGGDEADMTSFIMGAVTFDDLITRLDYIAMITNRDASLIAEIKALRQNLVKTRAELDAQRKERQAEYSQQKATRAVLYKKLAARQGEYNKIQGQLNAALARERASGYVTWAPKGANGMVFPVRGVHSYRNSWGEPRSGGRHHKGTDIMAPRGAPVVATVSGTVMSKYSRLGGKTIYLTGDNGWRYYYAHLNGYVVTSGRVKAGQLIAYNGSTGNASGGAPHVHFQMQYHGGAWVNPYPYLRGME